MNAKQRFFDAAFNNEPCNGSTYINSYSANSVPKHQLLDVMNSNIQNKNVLNNAEATAVSNIPGKVFRIMFSPTLFLQYEKVNMSHITMTIHIGKFQQQKYMVATIFQGKEM